MRSTFFMLMFAMNSALPTHATAQENPTADIVQTEPLSPTSLEHNKNQIDEKVDQHRQQLKTVITPSTQDVGHAMYYKKVAQKIEEVATVFLQSRDGKNVYGEGVVSVPISQDGNLFEAEGGPLVERTSGSEILDRYILRIVRRSTPFPTFSPSTLATTGEDVRILIYRFSFLKQK